MKKMKFRNEVVSGRESLIVLNVFLARAKFCFVECTHSAVYSHSCQDNKKALFDKGALFFFSGLRFLSK